MGCLQAAGGARSPFPPMGREGQKAALRMLSGLCVRGADRMASFSVVHPGRDDGRVMSFRQQACEAGVGITNWKCAVHPAGQPCVLLAVRAGSLSCACHVLR